MSSDDYAWEAGYEEGYEAAKTKHTVNMGTAWIKNYSSTSTNDVRAKKRSGRAALSPRSKPKPADGHNAKSATREGEKT